jgi:L-threonylcarbamoyladenylate synthase
LESADLSVIKCACKGNKGEISDDELGQVRSALNDGQMIVYPTETLYGLGANALDATAVKKVFMAKNRPFDMPLSVAVSSIPMLDQVAILDQTSRKLARRFMPGPITLLLTKKMVIPEIVTAASDEVGIRMPDHPMALKIIGSFGPITSTSANIHSEPDPVTIAGCIRGLGDAVSYYIDCGKSRLGIHSTIVAVREGEIEIIRQGAIPTKEIEAALNE